MPPHNPSAQRAELVEQRRKVDFDSYDITVDELIRRIAKRRIEIAPAYQRQFRWDAVRQSRLIESMLLGIPVPPLFMATNTTETGTSWEVVDGVQRLLSLTNFLADKDTRTVARLDGKPLRLKELDILETLEGSRADDLPSDIRTGLEDRPVKVIVLNDKSDLQVRFDLFERLNTGGVALTDHEVREAVFSGPFIDMLTHLASSDDFKTVVRLPERRQRDGTPQDYALRYFAFKDEYRLFDHSVRDFLNDYCRRAATDPQLGTRESEFVRTFRFLAEVFPNGLKSRMGTTPVNLFEGVAAGAALALEARPRLTPPASTDWVSSDELKRLVTGATNNRARVTGRVEYCRDRFLAG